MAMLAAYLADGELSQRGVDRVLRLAWTLADLDASPQPDIDHVGRALELRGVGALVKALDDAVLGILGEGTGGGDNGAHLAEHLHHEDGEETSDEVSEEHCGACGGNTNAGSKEKARAYSGAEAHHGEVADLEAAAKSV